MEARIAKLPDGSRPMVVKLHRIIRKLAPDLAPSVKWGHLVYLRSGKMALYVAGHARHVRIGPMVKGMPSTVFRDAGEIDEAAVAAVLKQVPK